MDSTAGFRYRAAGTAYEATVAGNALGTIDAVRVIALARQHPETGGQDDVVYGWGVNVHLRNAR